MADSTNSSSQTLQGSKNASNAQPAQTEQTAQTANTAPPTGHDADMNDAPPQQPQPAPAQQPAQQPLPLSAQQTEGRRTPIPIEVARHWEHHPTRLHWYRHKLTGIVTENVTRLYPEQLTNAMIANELFFSPELSDEQIREFWTELQDSCIEPLHSIMKDTFKTFIWTWLCQRCRETAASPSRHNPHNNFRERGYQMQHNLDSQYPYGNGPQPALSFGGGHYGWYQPPFSGPSPSTSHGPSYGPLHATGTNAQPGPPRHGVAGGQDYYAPQPHNQQWGGQQWGGQYQEGPQYGGQQYGGQQYAPSPLPRMTPGGQTNFGGSYNGPASNQGFGDRQGYDRTGDDGPDRSQQGYDHIGNDEPDRSQQGYDHIGDDGDYRSQQGYDHTGDLVDSRDQPGYDHIGDVDNQQPRSIAERIEDGLDNNVNRVESLPNGRLRHFVVEGKEEHRKRRGRGGSNANNNHHHNGNANNRKKFWQNGNRGGRGGGGRGGGRGRGGK